LTSFELVVVGFGWKRGASHSVDRLSDILVCHNVHVELTPKGTCAASQGKEDVVRNVTGLNVKLVHGNADNEENIRELLTIQGLTCSTLISTKRKKR